ncbi:ABC transporter ATP-binding protein [Clostridium folliculivorans]|uniref:ABC transporter ATP-binding protein n=1 Tax=Clostridium folliculivorans TaxID=2886038 RepID=A0A9W5Y1I4_9CLOT|nr:ABC transporter ATP-binding protein [Clostridium folliculivorans]GKU25029.1 ABC transporter ATP-binding protein [Clostridium folliculivorans]GKU31127.1 ABC transporter ATP-binding protein [Clostridium folliculivorans]
MNKVLTVEKITKEYGRKNVLEGVNLSVNQGEIIGLVGPNGAGKTTLMKIITGLIKNYSGDVFIENENIKTSKRKKTKSVGCVIETPGFYPNLTGYENLLFFAEISGMRDKSEIDEIVKSVGIEDYVHKKVKQYSLGMKQRLGVAQAVLTYPPLLILDEPTNGLDPAIVPKLRKFIKQLAKEKNTAVLISSHILSEIELMCDKVVFIQQGKIIKIESLNRYSEDGGTVSFVTSKIEALESFLNERNLSYKVIDKDQIQCKINTEDLENLVSSISKADIPLRSVYEVKDSLEKKYLDTMRGE